MSKRPKSRNETKRSKMVQALAEKGFTADKGKEMLDTISKRRNRPKARKK